MKFIRVGDKLSYRNRSWILRPKNHLDQPLAYIMSDKPDKMIKAPIISLKSNSQLLADSVALMNEWDKEWFNILLLLLLN